MVWLFLFLLGLTLYFIVQQSVVRITRAPWWQLWLVLMIPAFAIAGWTLTQRGAMPTLLLVGSFIVSVVLYAVLIGANPRTPAPESSDGVSANASDSKPDPSKLPPSPLNTDEQAQLQNCFPWSVYYLKTIDLRPQAVICRGQLRSEPEVAYQTIRQNIQAEFGDRFLVLFQPNADKQPYFALVANPYATSQPATRPQRINRPFLALALLVLTLVTTTLAGLSLERSDLKVAELQAHPELLWHGLPYAIALLTILGIHELGHYFSAQYYRIKATLPYFIPLPVAFGTFGAYIQLRSPVPHRKALFDVGIAGPLAGLVVTLPILIWGLMHSELAPLPAKASTLSLDAFNPRFSIAFAALCRMIFSADLTNTVGVHLHPVAVAGWLGLIVTALNLMPFGQLDGGHIVHAMYGQRMAIAISQVCRILVFLLSFVQPILLFWCIVLLFMPAADEPALNDVSELDNYRDALGLLALSILLLILLPVPPALESLFFLTNPTP